jgi:hypothetical protein
MAINNSRIRNLADIPLGDSSSRVLGRGISYPFTFSSTGRAEALEVQQGVRKVNQAIHMLLATRLGERILLPEYGSKLPELVFEPNDEILHTELQFWVTEAILRWEKRITLTGVTTIDAPDLSEISIKIDYTINNYHVQGSYVYPFKLGGVPLSETVMYAGV